MNTLEQKTNTKYKSGKTELLVVSMMRYYSIVGLTDLSDEIRDIFIRSYMKSNYQKDENPEDKDESISGMPLTAYDSNPRQTYDFVCEGLNKLPQKAYWKVLWFCIKKRDSRNFVKEDSQVLNWILNASLEEREELKNQLCKIDGFFKDNKDKIEDLIKNDLKDTE